MSFTEAVRKSKVRGPQQQKYAEDAWTAVYLDTSDGSQSDANLYHAGLWFAKRFDSSRQAWSALPKLAHSTFDIARAVVAYTNFLTVGSRKSMRARIDGVSAADDLERFPDFYEQATNESEKINHLVDSARVPLANALAGFEPDGALVSGMDTGLELIHGIRLRAELGQNYDGLQRLWSECIWNEWYVTSESGYDIVGPSRMDRERWRSIGSFRHSSLMNEFTSLGHFQWRKLPLRSRIELAGANVIVSIKRHAKRLKFQLGANHAELQNPPTGWLARAAASEIYLDEILNEPLPNYGGITVRDLLNAHYALSPLADILASDAEELEWVSTAEDLYRCAPKIHVDDLVHTISEALTIDRNRARAVLSALTFDKSHRDDLWLKPFVPLDGAWLTVVFESLKTPNLSWAIDNWLQLGGFQMSERGPSFEQNVIAEVASECKLGNAEVVPHSVTVKASGGFEEIDFVCRIGSTVLIGEVKCTTFPIDPFNIRSYSNVLLEGAAQAVRKAKFVRKNPDAFLTASGLSAPGESALTFVPLVISNLTLGSGLPGAAAPVVDRLILTRYLADGTLKWFGSYDSDGKVTAVEEIALYGSEHEAELNILEYLSDPPQITRLFPLTAVSRRPLLHFQSEKPAVFVSVRTEPFEEMKKHATSLRGKLGK